jgi:hypothetical protein
MQSTRIFLLCIGMAVTYGILHDQITARVCLEYFTVAHPPRITSQSPTIVGLYWGFAATAWIGALLGILLAVASRAGSRPRLSARELVRPVALLFGAMAICSAVAGILGYLLVSSGVATAGEWSSIIEPHRHARFMADVYSHLSSYGSGSVGGTVIVIWALCQRQKRQAAAGSVHQG